MTGLPEITIAGTVVADPELRFTPTAVAVANFTVAANDRRYNRDTSQWEDKTATFLRCSVWRQAAENAAETLTRGTRVLLTAQLCQRDWQTTEGEKRTSFEVDVTEIGPSLKWASATIHKPTRQTPPRTAPQRAQPTGTGGALSLPPAAPAMNPRSDPPPPPIREGVHP